MTVIDDYYQKLKQDIETKQLADECGESKEQLFTRYAVELLMLNKETENVSVVYDAETNIKRKPHKVNAFAIQDGSERADLFVSIFKSSSQLAVLEDKDILDAARGLSNFYIKAAKEDYGALIAESSEIFDCADAFAHDEELKANLKELNFFVLTNCHFGKQSSKTFNVGGINATLVIVDINYLHELSKDTSAPIVIDFEKRGFDKVSCITEDTSNDLYQVFLAIIPGTLLADLYEEYGIRLMENNVRQFLQATGKVNKGIQETIQKEPGMFLAYNNGIAATANEIVMDKTGRYIRKLSNLQIVNGGQTTASLHYARKMDPNARLSSVFVQVKFSIIKKLDRYNEIVAMISKCANMQNKVSDSDFSANDASLKRIEDYSRLLLAQPNNKYVTSTYWFFERTRGQYKNMRLKDGFTKMRATQFDLLYPKKHVMTKHDIAKYINSYDVEETVFESPDGNICYRATAGPQMVCRGNEKSFDYFIRRKIPQPNEITNIYFEDLVAKALLFKEAEARYGSGRGPKIGDLRKTVVPYAIAMLKIITKGNLNLYKIWYQQEVSLPLSNFIYDLMVQIHKFIINNSQTSRYEEWGKKEECWNTIINHKWNYNLNSIAEDLIDPNNPPKRTIMTTSDSEQLEGKYNREYVESVPYQIWNEIYIWGEQTDELTSAQKIACKEIYRALKYGEKLKDADVTRGKNMLDIVCDKNIELLYNCDNYPSPKMASGVSVSTPQGETALKNVPSIRLSIAEARNLFTIKNLMRMHKYNDDIHVLPAFRAVVLKNLINKAIPRTDTAISSMIESYKILSEYGFEL